MRALLTLWGALLLGAPERIDEHTIAGERHYVEGWPASNADATLNLVVEMPAGTTEIWEVDPGSGRLRWTSRHGELPVVRYLPAPWNYGMIPQTLDADGAPLDALVLAPAAERGTVLRVKPIGLLFTLDGGERDDKLIAVPTSGPLSELTDATELRALYPGVDDFLRLWFAYSRGRGPVMVKQVLGPQAAWQKLEETRRAFAARRS